MYRNDLFRKLLWLKNRSSMSLSGLPHDAVAKDLPVVQ